MAKKKPDATEAPDGTEAPKRGKKKLLVIVALVLALGGGGGYVVLGGSKGKPAAAAEPLPGVVVPLSPVTLNLVDGHYLQVGLGLQLAKGKSLGDGAEADPVADGAKALDQAISLFGSRSMPSLVGAGREKAKAQLATRLEKAYEGKVIGVYFTTFVMT